MVDFWDTSAIVPLLVREEDSVRRESEFLSSGPMVVWWGTSVEITSALARRNREGLLVGTPLEQAKRRLAVLREQWIRVMPVDSLIRRAERLLWVHSLRAADAKQLAAALIACKEETQQSVFYCADRRLGEVAAKEGFEVK